MKAQRIVLKFGSGILTNARGDALDDAQFERLVREVAALVHAGHECIIVSSGAVAAGMHLLRLAERPSELAAVQACAAVGQSKLMQLYSSHFATHRLNVGQLLLTHSDLDSRMRHRNARNTLQHLLARKDVVPIINENDSIAVEELRFGDNDRLSAEVAILASAELLILLTSVEGLMDESGKVVAHVDDVDAVASLAREEKGRFSTGGMGSKLQAVKVAVEAGIPTVITSGCTAGRIAAVVANEVVGTRFSVGTRRRTKAKT